MPTSKTNERRIERLELLVSQQGYVLHILMIVSVVDTAALLTLWQEQGKPDFDHIAVALSAFQILFGVAALYGFWALRGLTKERAEEVAGEAALAEAKRLIPSIVAREMRENIPGLRIGDPISDDDATRMAAAYAADDEEDDENG